MSSTVAICYIQYSRGKALVRRKRPGGEARRGGEGEKNGKPAPEVRRGVRWGGVQQMGEGADQVRGSTKESDSTAILRLATLLGGRKGGERPYGGERDSRMREGYNEA